MSLKKYTNREKSECMIKHRVASLITAVLFIFSGTPPVALLMAQQQTEHARNTARPEISLSQAQQDFQSIIQERLARGRFRSAYRKTSPISHTQTRSNERRRIGTESRNSGWDEFSPYHREISVRSQKPSDQYPETYPRRLVHRRHSDPALH